MHVQSSFCRCWMLGWRRQRYDGKFPILVGVLVKLSVICSATTVTSIDKRDNSNVVMCYTVIIIREPSASLRGRGIHFKCGLGQYFLHSLGGKHLEQSVLPTFTGLMLLRYDFCTHVHLRL